MNLLLLSHTTTSSTFVVGSHHYLRELNSTPGCNVLHVSSPDYPFSFMKRKEPRQRHSLDPKVHGVFPLGRFQLPDMLSNTLILRKIMRELHVRSMLPLDFIVIDQPSFADVAIKLTRMQSASLVYRPTDVYLDMMGERIRLYERKILEHADGIAATSNVVLQHLIEQYAVIPAKKIVIENGYDANHFHRTSGPGEIPPKRLVYVGALDARFDFNAIQTLAENSPELHIDIFGPLTAEATAIEWPSNVSLKGAVDYSSVPSVLSDYDVALLPMKISRANEGRSPMKLYEYLACGLPVLSRATSSLQSSKLRNIYFYDEQTSPKDALRFVKDFVPMDDQLLPQSWQQKTLTLIKFLKSVSATKSTGTPS